MSQKKLNTVKAWMEGQQLPQEVEELLTKAVKNEQARLDKIKRRKDSQAAYSNKNKGKVNQLEIMAEAIRAARK